MDEYFIGILEKIATKLDEVSLEAIENLKQHHERRLLGDVNRLWIEREKVNQAAESGLEKNVISDTSLATIVNEALRNPNNYHVNAKVEVNNPNLDYDAIAKMTGHYSDTSIVGYYNGVIFDAKSASAWKELGIKVGETVELYAQNHKGNLEAAENAIHHNLARLLGKEHHIDKDKSHYMHRKLVVKSELGLHARPAALIVKAANTYEPEIYLRKSGSDEIVSAKGIMGVLTLGASWGEEVDVMFQPREGINDSETTRVFNLMKEAVKYEG